MFRPSDLDQIYYQYFDEIWQTSRVYADPSGWTDTYSSSAGLLPSVTIDSESLGRYYLDEGSNLGDLKANIVDLLSFWENSKLEHANVTLYNSVSTGSAAVLVALKEVGVTKIFFETPAYSVTINQAEHLGLDYELLPTYKKDGFRIDGSRIESRTSSCALWLTHPRISLGTNQSLDDILRLAERLTDNDFIVIDEATEQKIPSVLRTLDVSGLDCTPIRLRGILKGAGLNAVRLAAVLHPQSFRGKLEDVQSTLGASLDVWSLKIGAQFIDDLDGFVKILTTASKQASTLNETIRKMTFGSPLQPSKVENGYMGCLFLDMSAINPGFPKARQMMLAHLKRKRIPVILGSALLFAFDPPWEQIRINYFNRDTHALRLIDELLTLLGG